LLLIYTHRITPRLTYIFKHIFSRILQIPISFTTKVEEFVAHSGPKITYTTAALGKEFFIKNNSLLFNQGVNDVLIKVNQWDEVPCFFSAGEDSSIPYDIFAASFYLMSRYEEYQPHVSDENERFSAENSLAFQKGFLEKPVIDLWAYKLVKKLKEKYPDYSFPNRKATYLSTINVNNAFAYKHKGIIRNIGGFFRDIAKFSLRSFARRMLVLLGLKEDPYNTFESIIKLGKQHNLKTIFFFLFSEYTTYDKNISYANTGYKLMIKSIIDYAPFGQLFSYYTMRNSQKLNKEKKRFENIVNRPVLKSRQFYNRFDIPKSYQNLIDAGIEEDYSMGYNTHVGFRASTCTPFYFYDLDFEIQTPLKVYSFAVFVETLKKREQLTPKEALLKIFSLQHEVQKVNGTFVSVFQNATLSDMQTNIAWADVYEKSLLNFNSSN